MPKTARDATKTEMLAYRPWAALDSYRGDPGIKARQERAWQVAKDVATLLKARYRAKRVVVFGSLVRESVFTPWSDIDLAVWGLSPEDYFDAVGEAMERGLDEGVSVDVVDMGTSPPSLREVIEREGVEL